MWSLAGGKSLCKLSVGILQSCELLMHCCRGERAHARDSNLLDFRGISGPFPSGLVIDFNVLSAA